jgi:hypothetical protein
LILIPLIALLPATAEAQIGPQPPPPAVSVENPPVWVSTDAAGDTLVHLYVFHSLTCPHCREAMPFIESLPATHPWLRLHAWELSESQANANGYVQFAEALGEQAMYVPAFFYCGQMITGYDTDEQMGAAIEANLVACYEAAEAEQKPAAAPAGDGAAADGAAAGPAMVGAEGAALGAAVDRPAPVAESITVPLLGAVTLDSLSLPVLTVTLAALDAFNPCAFFVLMFLLSLMVHAKNRGRMLLIGGVFVLFSALIYFVFMAAWLNVFLWIGELQLITLIAGIVAVIFALINIKDYFWFKQGVSLGIPDEAKPGLFKRMRGLVSAESLPAMLGGTVVLAVAANSYELLCTSGFPMVYTRALTLNDLSTAGFYGYLALYNLIYIIPLLIIVALFAVRFGSRKLSENEGRVLKLLSGIMMLSLGITLVFAPEALNNPITAIGLLVMTLVVTFVIVQIERWRTHGGSGAPKQHAKR